MSCRNAQVLPQFDDASEAGLTSTTTTLDQNTYSGGTVAFSADLLSTYTPGDTGADPARPFFLHELAHLVGLGHVNDQTQIMFPYTGFARTFGRRDLTGLRALAPRGYASTTNAHR